jgi:hypothetical protein
MEVTFTVSKWDEKPVDDTRKEFPINIPMSNMILIPFVQ